ncbi:uncharacterized protein LAESUDRAFT_725285 [Laetiporus sulphureus 93-53]|uniref:Uncharacterized protein n=1 Tax=Laetiporus sulphureus 93-53 TaxID=1314785 RepID=A0A165EFT9_9APHY|nr:uncharacterized protein LAESUDRAFT_725285 [Laetiporus sulphureus 93-53]KZT06971.1 hypothetical protein LAESUDRAFT_725285 [Laetiporus sulphureus 93-53]
MPLRPSHHSSDSSDDSSSDEDDGIAQIITLIPISSSYSDKEFAVKAAPDVPLPSALPPNLQIIPEVEDDDSFEFDLPPPYHGISDNALALVKRVWNSRRVAWSNQNIRHEAAAAAIAYDGTLDQAQKVPTSGPPSAPPALPPPSLPAGIQAPPPDAGPIIHAPTPDPNVPIYPRLGDLSSIHDGRYVSVDRAFRNFPTYTIRKILYLHDMLDNARSSSPSHPPRRSASLILGDDKRSAADRHPSAPVWDGRGEKISSMALGSCTNEGQSASYRRWQVLMEKTRQPRAPVRTAGISAKATTESSRMVVSTPAPVPLAVPAPAPAPAPTPTAAPSSSSSKKSQDKGRTRTSSKPKVSRFFFAKDESDSRDARSRMFSITAQFLNRRSMNDPMRL